MPRLKKTVAQLHEDELAEKNKLLIKVIDGNTSMLGMRRQDVAKAINMPYSTYCYRCMNPDTWRRGELIAVFEVLKVPENEKTQAAMW